MPPCETAKAKREHLARKAKEAYLIEEVKAEPNRTAAKKAEEKYIAFKKKLKANCIAT
ncbi:uncharacterized protein FFB20_15925 [Fusarium fujikuroi]|nr:uncharacterized protein FFB20_15925 [Fusarium fujikuroi]